MKKRKSNITTKIEPPASSSVKYSSDSDDNKKNPSLLNQNLPSQNLPPQNLPPENLTTQPQLTSQNVANPDALEAKIQRWYDRVNRNRVQFGVTLGGEILKDSPAGATFARSNVKESLRFLITKNGISPSGTETLRKRLITDSFFANVLEPQTGSGWKPRLW
uniref:Uncharacterized protein n=1 Tax=Panagrolaimus davidi TaxID=227884 RepID=A0A914PFQ7_9BILA